MSDEVDGDAAAAADDDDDDDGDDDDDVDDDDVDDDDDDVDAAARCNLETSCCRSAPRPTALPTPNTWPPWLPLLAQ